MTDWIVSVLVRCGVQLESPSGWLLAPVCRLKGWEWVPRWEWDRSHSEVWNQERRRKRLTSHLACVCECVCVREFIMGLTRLFEMYICPVCSLPSLLYIYTAQLKSLGSVGFALKKLIFLFCKGRLNWSKMTKFIVKIFDLK